MGDRVKGNLTFLYRACSGDEVKKVPHDQSLASPATMGGIVKSAGKPGNGSLEPDGSRLQAQTGASHRQVGKSVIRGEKKAKAKKYSLTGK